ncbi:MAG: hypothetical protein L3K26_09620, partial [Candidatus Hydrogenedentes bacterium]|nr:hypothetical protein [Candidatus Hydrogenedentota bacterium]
MVSSFLLVLLPLLGAVTDIEQALHGTLSGGDATVAQVQAAWAETMGLRSATADGFVASGYQVDVRSLNPAELEGEIPEGTQIRHYVEVRGHGPEPLQLFFPKSPDDHPMTIYRRVEAGLFVEPAAPPVSVGGFWRVDVSWPGRFVVHEPQKVDEGKLLFPEFPDSVAGPDRKGIWRLFRAAPNEAVGPVPLLMIHGAGTDRWGEFTHWVRSSPEAAEFRANFQLWSFSHNMAGINAPIGFDPDCPDYEESIVAYLARFLEEATEVGAPTINEIYKFPSDGPMTIITNSHGALKARAFMINYPEYGDRVLGAVTLGGPHTGTPWATPEWLRFTASRFGL